MLWSLVINIDSWAPLEAAAYSTSNSEFRSTYERAKQVLSLADSLIWYSYISSLKESKHFYLVQKFHNNWNRNVFFNDACPVLTSRAHVIFEIFWMWVHISVSAHQWIAESSQTELQWQEFADMMWPSVTNETVGCMVLNDWDSPERPSKKWTAIHEIHNEWRSRHPSACR